MKFHCYFSIIYIFFFAFLGMHGQSDELAAKYGRHIVRSWLLRNCLPEAVLSGHSTVRDKRNDTENQIAANGVGVLDTWSRIGTTTGEPFCFLVYLFGCTFYYRRERARGWWEGLQ